MTSPRDRTALRQWELRFGPNMTPMVDIVMVILIFFMAASALLGPEWFLRTALPGTGAASAASADPFELPPARFELRITRDDEGRTVVTGWGQPATLEETESRLLALGRNAAAGKGGADIIVLIDPDPQVPYRDVVRLHDACLQANITQVGLTARNP